MSIPNRPLLFRCEEVTRSKRDMLYQPSANGGLLFTVVPRVTPEALAKPLNAIAQPTAGALAHVLVVAGGSRRELDDLNVAGTLAPIAVRVLEG